VKNYGWVVMAGMEGTIKKRSRLVNLKTIRRLKSVNFPSFYVHLSSYESVTTSTISP
jgi:hypothetical protein